MNLHLQQEHHLHDMDNITEPTVDGKYYLHLDRISSVYTYGYRHMVYGKAKSSNNPNVDCTLANTEYPINVTYANGLANQVSIDNVNYAVKILQDSKICVDLYFNCYSDTTTDQEISIHLYQGVADLGVVSTRGFAKKDVSGAFSGFEFVDASANDLLTLKVENNVAGTKIYFNNIAMKVRYLE